MERGVEIKTEILKQDHMAVSFQCMTKFTTNLKKNNKARSERSKCQA